MTHDSSAPTEHLSGIVERITFFNEINGWSVIKVTPIESRRRHRGEITITIHHPKIFPGSTFDFWGQWMEHPKYGSQFKATKISERRPANQRAMEKYLASGLIYGVGPKTAERIVSTFKDETLDVFESDIKRLLTVPGIAKKKLEKIAESWQEHREIRNIMIFLQEFGVSTVLSSKIYKRYGDEAISVIKTNPYQLASDIYGIGFFTADRMALKMGVGRVDPLRLKAAILYVLTAGLEDGHCFLKGPQIIQKVLRLLEIKEKEAVVAGLEELVKEKTVILRHVPAVEGLREQTDFYYYSKKFYFEEAELAKKCLALKGSQCPRTPKQVVDLILGEIGPKLKLTLSDEQRDGVYQAFQNKIFILTGGPGCGKTTTLKSICHVALRLNQKILLAAPTGRAAQRMEEVIGIPSKTLHRLLEWNPSQGGFVRNEEMPLHADMVVVDEVSMLDLSLALSLLRAISDKTTLLLIGDSDQLPSVGPGSVLRDLIESSAIAHHRLTQIFRQKASSKIITFAHQINAGEYPQVKSPFEEPQVWKEKVDALFIDAEEATAEELKFIKTLKDSFQKIKNQNQGEFSFKKNENKGAVSYYQWMYEKNELSPFVWEENIKEGEKEKGEGREKDDVAPARPEIFNIPKKFKHVNIPRLLMGDGPLEDIKNVIKKISPWSSLHWGHNATSMIVELYLKTIPRYFGPEAEIQILSPMVRGSLGTKSLNDLIQARKNPAAPQKKEVVIQERTYRVGDRVIQKVNNYKLDVFNGDIGNIYDIDHETNKMTICFGGGGPRERFVEYPRESWGELALAYAITIHKSQGSEFDVVILPVATQHFKMLFRNLLYTGMTRAKKQLIFLGTRKAFFLGIRNKSTQKRQTYLKEILQELPQGCAERKGAGEGTRKDSARSVQ